MECGPSQYWYLSEARGMIHIQNGRFDAPYHINFISFT